MLWRGGLEAVERWFRGSGVVLWRLWRGGMEAVDRWYGGCGEEV